MPALAWLLAAPASAQTTSASLSGGVKTQTGEAVAGAVVLARSEASGVVRQAVTGEDGRYRIDLLEPGTWTVVARLADGRAGESRVIRLGLQEAIKLDFRVGGGLEEKVTVTAERPLVDPLETSGKLRVSGDQADVLPLSGRVFTDLAKLDSSVGAAAPGNFFGERGSVFVVNGQSGRSNTFLVDGLDNNDQVSGSAPNSFYTQQAIAEFVLLTNQYAPEFGRASGGVLNVVTRQGSNEPSWEAFAQGSADSWNSSGEFVDSLPDLGSSRDSASRFQGGFNLSGPMKRDKSFYFVAYEHQELRDVVGFTGVTRDGVPGGSIVTPGDDDNLFVRTDFNLNGANRLMLRFTADDRSTEGVNVGGVYTPDSGFSIDEKDFSLAGTWTTVISSTLINEARAMVGTSSFDQTANSELSGVTRPSGIFGGNSLNGQARDETRFQFVENLTWRKGDHTWKFGVDVTHSRTEVATRFNPNGNFIYNSDFAFDPGDCGDLLLSHVISAGDGPLVDCPGVIGVDDDGDGLIDEPGNIDSYPVVFTLITGSPQAELDDTRFAFFVQDRFQVNDRLLFDYGLRYDLSTFTLDESARVDSTIPNGGADRDTDNLAPRFGFTYTPGKDARTVIRGGAGIFYDKLVLGFPAVAAITSGTEIGLTFPQGLTLEITEDFVEEEGIDAVLPGVVFPPELTLRFSTGTELETPYTIQANLGGDRSLGRNSALHLGATYAEGHDLAIMRDLNPVTCIPSENPSECFLLPVHRDPMNGSIAAITTEGRSWYTAFDVGWKWRKETSFLSASYTWSEAEDLGFDPLKGGISLPPDSDNIAAERGRSDGNRRHRFVFSGAFALPWMELNLSTVVQLASGLPFNVTTGQDENLDGILSERPEGVGRNSGADTPLAAVNALRIEQNDRLMQVDPDGELLPMIESLDEPSFSQVDLRIYRPFAFGEKGQAEFFLQVNNLFDTNNVGLIEGRAISKNFGRAIGVAGPPRIIELGLKFRR